MREDIVLGLSDPWWRLCSLYWIVDKDGRPVRFKPNAEQADFYASLHTRNAVLKARQKGFSTLMQIIGLDQCLFNDNFASNIIADTLPNAGKLFRKAAFAYERLPEIIKAHRPLKSQTTSEMVFANGSSFSVGTSARGGTVQFLHISEMGKIAKKYPEKAREIVTGAFEAVPLSGVIVVESTAEGNGGEFFDICDSALKLREAQSALTGLDFKLHFYPWFNSPEYRIDPQGVIFSEADKKYFREVEAATGVTLDLRQRAWYVKKRAVLKRDMKREYPATIKESFEQAIEGAIYGEEMTFLRERGRLCSIPIDPIEPVNTFWDLGSNDHTAIWLHQRVGAWNHFIGYMHGTRTGLKKWWQQLEDWREENGVERWGRHYLPHDGEAERQGEEIESARTILEGLKVKNIEIVPRVATISIGIDKTRAVMTKNVRIDPVACVEGIRCLDSYQFEWDQKLGQWKNFPLHNWASNGADAFRQHAQGYSNTDDRIPPTKSWRDRLKTSNNKGSAQAA
jgi:hypothetical protein